MPGSRLLSASPAIGAPDIAIRRNKHIIPPAGRQPGDWRHNHRRQAKQTLHPACRANSPAIGAPNIAVRRNKHIIPPTGRTARRLAQNKPPGIRSDIAQPGAFCRGVREGSGLVSSTRAATTARRAPAKRDRSVIKSCGRRDRRGVWVQTRLIWAA